ncbi:MAG: 30S ribosomal protein S4 [Clostridia bacterium]|nr:30S ribosomal protein S4 [Clostridia bacterium]
MAVDRVPILKRCKALDINPSVLGYDKESNRQVKKTNKKMSEYALHLREKQKAKFIYGVLEKPFRNYYEKAAKMPGQTGENLMTMLESRLDNVVFRMTMARTRKEARQLVDHHFVTVNGKSVNIPSYLVKAGDVIEIAEKYKSNDRMKEICERTAARLVPSWIECDKENKKATITELPKREQIEDIPVNETLIVELYSK